MSDAKTAQRPPDVQVTLGKPDPVRADEIAPPYHEDAAPVAATGESAEVLAEREACGDQANANNWRNYQTREIVAPPEKPKCQQCGGLGYVSDMMTASIRTDTLPPRMDCPSCARSRTSAPTSGESKALGKEGGE